MIIRYLRILLNLFLGLSAILCLGIVIEVLFSPFAAVANFVEVSSIQRQLSQAKARWEVKGISNYSIEVDADIPFCGFEVILNVRDNRVISVIEKETRWLSREMCQHIADYSSLQIPQFLDRIEREVGVLDWREDSLAVDFDAEFGYVTYYRSSCSYRTHSIGDCIDVYKFMNFQPSDDSNP